MVAGECLMIDSEQIPPSHRTAVSSMRLARVASVPGRGLPRAARGAAAGDRDPFASSRPGCSADLQAILEQCYRNGGYDDIDYRGEPDPPLSAEDAAWADTLMRETGKR